jgi:uncharacterized ferritin-like protein (DUF455 family)
VGEEELPHVRFGLQWFKRFTGGDGFERWAEHLPPTRRPWLMNGPSLDRAARRRAGLPDEFLDALAGFAFVP